MRKFQIMAVLGFMSAVLIIASTLEARPRRGYEDAQVVERSELIVVGGIKDGSVRYVPHPHKPGDGMSHEHHAVLRIARVIKGKSDEKEIPIIIHYGLDPLVDGKIQNDGIMVNLAAPGDAARGAIQIFDSGNSSVGPPDPAIPDAREDNLWFLRRLGGKLGNEPGAGNFGIVDPEDLQALALEEYFKGYLTPDPEGAARQQLAKPEVAARALRYLMHREVQRIMQVADPNERVERLLPHFLSRSEVRIGYEARTGLVQTGAIAGPYLMGVYQSTRDTGLRYDIVRLWGQIRWPGCVDLLTKILKDQDRFWEGQKLEAGWWIKDGDSSLTQARRASHMEIRAAVSALGQIGDPRAREAIELTRRRWTTITADDHGLAKDCDWALELIGDAAATRPTEAK